MKKRLKIKHYIAGKAVKEFMADVLTSPSGSPTFYTTVGENDMYIAGWRGVLADSATITADGFLYTDAIFSRRYSVENSDIVPNGADLEVLPTESPVHSIVQFGDVAFNLTDETNFGTEYALTTTPSADDWYREPHEIVTYNPNLFGEVDLIFKNLSFEFGDSRVYGSFISGEVYLYQNAISSVSGNSTGSVYAKISLFDSLPFAYLMEQTLNNSVHITPPVKVYGSVTPEVIVYTPQPGNGLTENDNSLYTPFEMDQDEIDKIYFNPFKLKNMYNYNWNCEYNRLTVEMTGIRDYIKVGKTQSSLWLSYFYLRENPSNIQNFELVERIKGLYKFKPRANHKSNIYSISIHDSGLNEAMEDGPIKDKIRELIEHSIHKACKKIAPASTQLWKIKYVGE
jgi:hypothetical protein